MMPKEHKATGVLVMDIDHVSTKVRTGGPVDDKEDLGTDIWAGVVACGDRTRPAPIGT